MAGPPVLTVLVAAGTLLALAIGFVAVREYPNPMSVPIAVLAAAAAIWILPVGVGYHTRTIEHHLWIQRISYFGSAFVPLAYYFVAFRYAGYQRFLTAKVLALLGIVPLATLTLAWTNHLHDLVWVSIEVERIAGVWVASVDPGPWFTIHLLWAYGLIIVAFIVLIREVVRADSYHRPQTLVLFLGAAIPFALNAAHHLGIGILAEIDLTPVAVGVGAAILGIGLLVFDLVELRPVARDRLFEQLPDGVVVLDRHGRIRESNPIARQILDNSETDEPSAPGLPAEIRENGSEFTLTIDGEDRWFRTERHAFSDPSGAPAGTIVYLNDITELARREQRISVLHRVLRHNIRNEMTLLYGHLEYVQTKAGEEISDDVYKIERSADRIMGFAENARLIERTLKQDGTTHSVEVDTGITHAVELADRRVDTAAIEKYLGEAPLAVSVPDRELLVRSLAELIENGLVHGVGTVGVDVSRIDGWIDIEITDEGPGIPEGEIEALEAPVETSLEHGSGLGLWMARWTAELSGGELRFERAEGKNVVCMRLPPAEGSE